MYEHIAPENMQSFTSEGYIRQTAYAVPNHRFNRESDFTWQYAMENCPVVSSQDGATDGHTTYIILANAHSEVLASNRQAIGMLAQLFGVNRSWNVKAELNAWESGMYAYLKNIAMERESIEADILATTMHGMMNASPDASGYYDMPQDTDPWFHPQYDSLSDCSEY